MKAPRSTGLEFPKGTIPENIHEILKAENGAIFRDPGFHALLIGYERSVFTFEEFLASACVYFYKQKNYLLQKLTEELQLNSVTYFTPENNHGS